MFLKKERFFARRHGYTGSYNVVNLFKKRTIKTKTVLLRGRETTSNSYSLFTLLDKEISYKYLSKLVGEKLSILSPEEVKMLTYQESKTLAPFGYNPNFILLIDKELFSCDTISLFIGHSNVKIAISSKELNNILYKLKNKLIFF